MRRQWLVLGLMLAACGPVELRIDETKGVPSISGDTEVSLGGSFTCGDTITGDGRTVTTRAVTGGCEFTFDDQVEVLTAQDYKDIPDFDAPTNLVQRIELTIKKVNVVDGDSGAVLDLATRVTSAVVTVDGQQVADKSTLSVLPNTVAVSGALLTRLKTAIDARQPVSVDVKAVVVLPDSPPYPAKLKIDYALQPAVVLGTGSLF